MFFVDNQQQFQENLSLTNVIRQEQETNLYSNDEYQFVRRDLTPTSQLSQTTDRSTSNSISNKDITRDEPMLGF